MSHAQLTIALAVAAHGLAADDEKAPLPSARIAVVGNTTGKFLSISTKGNESKTMLLMFVELDGTKVPVALPDDLAGLRPKE